MPISASSPAKKATPLDKYEWVRELGRGSYGSVWLVKRKSDKKLFAAKRVLLPPLACKDEKALAQRRQALREVEILQQIESPNVVGYAEALIAPTSAERQQSELYIITEYCNGGDLAMHLGNVKEGEGLAEGDIWHIAISILQGLRELHSRSILHRDLKPANVFLKLAESTKPAEETSDQKKQNHSAAVTFLLGDLGVAREMSDSQPLASTMVGTPLYIAPEVFEGQPYGDKADVYSFGVCLYELMHRRAPFSQAQNMGALVRQVLNLDGRAEEIRLPMDNRYSLKLRDFTKRCLCLLPEDRPIVGDMLNTIAVSEVAHPLSIQDWRIACEEQDSPARSVTPAPAAKRLKRHSSQPRVPAARSPTKRAAAPRSPSVPPRSSAGVPCFSPRREAIPSKAKLARPKPKVSHKAAAVSKDKRAQQNGFSFRPPGRCTDVRVEAVQERVLPCAGADSTSNATESAASKSEPGGQPHCEPTVQTEAQRTLKRSSSAPALLQMLHALVGDGIHSVAIPQALAYEELTKKEDSVRALSCGRASSRFEKGSAGGSAALEAEQTAEPSVLKTVEDLTLADISFDVDISSMPEEIATEAPPCKDVCESPAIEKPCLIPQLRALAPAIPLSTRDDSSILSDRTNVYSGKPSPTSTPSSRRSESSVSNDAGKKSPFDLLPKRNAYAAKAQECWSRWRRQRVDHRKEQARKAQEAKKAQNLGSTMQKAPEASNGPDEILQVRGVAPPSTPVRTPGKKNARGAMAPARMLYSPPVRRPHGVRL